MRAAALGWLFQLHLSFRTTDSADLFIAKRSMGAAALGGLFRLHLSTYFIGSADHVGLRVSLAGATIADQLF